MNSMQYQEFTERLRQNLESKPQVMGLIALGSMAQQDYQPDRWSDHDFFVITQAGEQEALRLNLGWLPDFDQIVLSFRETAHGLKILYRNGHLLEFAIFDPEELLMTRPNRYRVLLDRGGLAVLIEILSAIPAQPETLYGGETSDSKRFGMFLCNLLVGVGRYRRGEKLSGHQFVKSYALQHLVTLLEKYLEAPNKGLLDNLDPWRRFERVFPETGVALTQILNAEVPHAAVLMLDLAQRELQGKLEIFSVETVKVVREQLA